MTGPEAVQYLAEDFARVVHSPTGPDTWVEFRLCRHDDGKLCFQTRNWYHTDWHDWDGLYGDDFAPGAYLPPADAATVVSMDNK